MNYFDVKFFHLFLTILYVFGLMTATYNPKLKLAKLFHYFVISILLLSGIWSTQKLGLPLDSNLPFWVMAKIGCWIILLIVPPIAMKRMPQHASKLNCIFIGIVVLATFLGVYKS